MGYQRRVHGGDSGKSKKAPISAWRTIFVANEWNEMQVERKINVEFTIIMVLFLLVGCDWQYLATTVPNGSDLTAGPVNPILRFVDVDCCRSAPNFLELGRMATVY